MDAWDCVLFVGYCAWRYLGRFYGLLRGQGMGGCMLAVVAGWQINRWGLRLTAHEPPLCGHPGRGRAGHLFGQLLQVGGTFLTAIAAVALVRSMVP